MDDIFDSLIYILITIVAFAISVLGKKKKKRPVSVQQNENNFRQTQRENSFIPSLEKIIKQQMGIDDTNLYSEFDDTINEKYQLMDEPIDSIPKEYLDDKPDIPYSIEYDNTDLIEEESIDKQDITKEELQSETILDEFDLKKAVIFSEILNRKEY